MSRPKNNMMNARDWFARTVRCFLVGVMGLGITSGVVELRFAGQSSAAALSPTARSWCSAYGSQFMTWSETVPDIAICGPGPAYGGQWQLVSLPGPGGTIGGYFNGTPGFQCVELAERYLAVAYGFAPTNAEGSTVAVNYHVEYPRTTLVVSGTNGAVGHAPVSGDVISFSLSPQFGSWGDGHVAVVVRSSINRSTGNGTVVVAQQNVASSDYIYRLNLVDWRLSDPNDPSNAEFQFPYAEWLHVVRLVNTHRTSPLVKSLKPHWSEPKKIAQL